MRALLLIALLIASPALAEPVPRTLVALYDSREEASPRTTMIHRFLEMPANYLGLVVEYQDVNKPLPAPGNHVRGIIVWFNPGTEVTDANAYLDWLNAATERGIKLIVLENFGLQEKHRASSEAMDKARRVLSRIGISDTNRWQSLTYNARIAHKDTKMLEFERKYETVLPPFVDTRKAGSGTRSYLSVISEESAEGRVESDLVVTAPGGGYAAAGYVLFSAKEEDVIRYQWYLHPFRFLNEALQLGDMPKPDVTTLSGNRIFYAQVEGDGWNELTTISQYYEQKWTAAEVIKKEILAAFPHLPFTVSPVAADLDKRCYGLKTSANVARDIFALPNVEAGVHSYSHPLLWRFFADYSKEKEKPYASMYPLRPRERASMYHALLGKFRSWRMWYFSGDMSERHDIIPPGSNDISDETALKNFYRTPRSYACTPFQLQSEVADAKARVQDLLPQGKEVRLFTWPGDTAPFEAAIKATREAGMANLNGGLAAINPESFSISSIPPTGLKVGKELQIYSANANERAYDDPFSTDFFAFAKRELAAKLTGTPQRLKPLQLYIHMLAGVQAPTLSAVQQWLETLDVKSITPITATDYAMLAQGFYTAELIEEDGGWRVKNRGALQTLRFDQAARKKVDFDRSVGVVGQRWLHGDLYVALDPAMAEPIIYLKNNDEFGSYPAEARPYLVQGSWPIINSLQISNQSLTFAASGWGAAQFSLRMPRCGNWSLRAEQQGKTLAQMPLSCDASDLLTFALTGGVAGQPVTFTLTPQ